MLVSPYVIVCAGHESRRTRVVAGEQNPSFEEEFYFTGTLERLVEKGLKVDVRDSYLDKTVSTEQDQPASKRAAVKKDIQAEEGHSVPKVSCMHGVPA